MKFPPHAPSSASAAVRAACLLSCGLAGVPAAGAAAADDWTVGLASPQEVIVVAQRRPMSLVESIGDVTVIPRSEIERASAQGLADLLARQPGFELARNGGEASTTSLFVRGAESRFVAVFIDGVRVDSQSTGGAAWEMLPLGLVDRIEILRGPAATVYGSDAIAGVVQVFTRRGQAGVGLQPRLRVGGGNQGRVLAEASVAGGDERGDFALGALRQRSSGFNARSTATANPDEDGFRREAAAGRVGLQLTPGQRVQANALVANTRGDYDGSATAADHSTHRLRLGGLEWTGRWGGGLESTLQASQSQTLYRTEPSFYQTVTRVRTLLAQVEQPFGPVVVQLGAERREDELDNAPTANGAALSGDRHIDGLSIGTRARLGRHLLQARLRHDRDSEFGGHRTGSLGLDVMLGDGWQAQLSGGTSFRAPTLYHRFSENGQSGLKPEQGRNVEAGLRWLGETVQASLSVWRNRVENLIVYGAAGPCQSTRGCYENAARARYQGVTLAAEQRVGAWTIKGSVDAQSPRDLATGKQLARRARHHATTSATLQQGWGELSAEWQLSGARWDNAANTTRLAGYGMLNLQASVPVTRDCSIAARIDNVGDKAYQTANTYNTAGRVWNLMLAWQPK